MKRIKSFKKGVMLVYASPSLRPIKDHLLVKEEKILTSCDQDGVIARKECHSVTESGCRRLALNLELHELSMHNLTVNDDRLEVSKLVLEFALCVLSSEEIDSILDGVALRAELLVIYSRFRRLYRAAGTLNERSHTLLELDLHPFHILKVAHDHLVVEHSTLSLSTVDDHALFKGRCSMILTSAS